MDDLYAINFAKTEVREAFNTAIQNASSHCSIRRSFTWQMDSASRSGLALRTHESQTLLCSNGHYPTSKRSGGRKLEVRDFYAGQPNLPIRGSMQHNVAFTGGLLIKF